MQYGISIKMNGDRADEMKTKRMEIDVPDMDQYGYFTEGSAGLSIIKKSNGGE